MATNFGSNSTKESAQFGKAMNTIAAGQAMMAAVRDYTKELIDNEGNASSSNTAVHIDDLMDDPELAKVHEARIARLKEEREKRTAMTRKGHGSLQEISEGEFLEIVTNTEFVVCHFFHREFETCKIMDKHLSDLAHEYFETRFIKLSAPDAPFFCTKLNVKVLPCVLCFVHGVAVDRVVGFEPLGSRNDFPTSALEDLLLISGVLKRKARPEEEEEEKRTTSIRSGFGLQRTQSDEDSDFD